MSASPTPAPAPATTTPAPDPTGAGTLADFLGDLLHGRVSLNRIVAFAGPYISIGAGAVAQWLLVHVHVLGGFHFGKDQLATGVASAAVWILTAGLTWLGQSAWLRGHHILLAQAVDNPPPKP